MCGDMQEYPWLSQGLSLLLKVCRHRSRTVSSDTKFVLLGMVGRGNNVSL